MDCALFLRAHAHVNVRHHAPCCCAACGGSVVKVGHLTASHFVSTGVPWVSLLGPTSVPSDAQAGWHRGQSAKPLCGFCCGLVLSGDCGSPLSLTAECEVTQGNLGGYSNQKPQIIFFLSQCVHRQTAQNTWRPRQHVFVFLSSSLSFSLFPSFFSFQLCFDPRMRNSCCVMSIRLTGKLQVHSRTSTTQVLRKKAKNRSASNSSG